MGTLTLFSTHAGAAGQQGRQLPTVLECTLTESVNEAGMLEFSVPSADGGGIDVRTVVRLTEDDGFMSEWVVRSVTTDPMRFVTTVQAHDPILRLQEGRPLRTGTESTLSFAVDGTRRVRDWIETVVLAEPFLTEDALTMFAVGTIEDDALVPLTITGRTTRLAVLQELAKQSAQEVWVTFDPPTGKLLLHFAVERNGERPIERVRFAGKLRSFALTRDTENVASVIEAYGDDQAADLSQATWAVAAVTPIGDGTTATFALRDPASTAGEGPVSEEAQFVGYAARFPRSGRIRPVTACAPVGDVTVSGVQLDDPIDVSVNLLTFSNRPDDPSSHSHSAANAIHTHFAERYGSIRLAEYGNHLTSSYVTRLCGTSLREALVNGSSYVAWCVMKKGTATATDIEAAPGAPGTGTYAKARVTWSATPTIANSVGSGATITSLGGDYYRVALPFTATGTTLQLHTWPNALAASQVVRVSGWQLVAGTSPDYVWRDTGPTRPINYLRGTGLAAQWSVANVTVDEDPMVARPTTRPAIAQALVRKGTTVVGTNCYVQMPNNSAVPTSSRTPSWFVRVLLKASPVLAERGVVRVQLGSGTVFFRADLDTSATTWTPTNTIGTSVTVTALDNGWWVLEGYCVGTMISSLTLFVYPGHTAALATPASVYLGSPVLQYGYDSADGWPLTSDSVRSAVFPYAGTVPLPLTDATVGDYVQLVRDLDGTPVRMLESPSLTAFLRGPKYAALPVPVPSGVGNLLTNPAFTLQADGRALGWTPTQPTHGSAVPRIAAFDTPTEGRVNGDQGAGSSVAVQSFPSTTVFAAGERVRIDGATATVSAAAMPAADGTLTVPVNALPGAIGSGVSLSFSGGVSALTTTAARVAGDTTLPVSGFTPPPTIAIGDVLRVTYTGRILRACVSGFPSLTFGEGQWIVLDTVDACVGTNPMPASYTGAVQFIGYEGGDRTKPRYYCAAGVAVIYPGGGVLDYGTEVREVSTTTAHTVAAVVAGKWASFTSVGLSGVVNPSTTSTWLDPINVDASGINSIAGGTLAATASWWRGGAPMPYQLVLPVDFAWHSATSLATTYAAGYRPVQAGDTLAVAGQTMAVSRYSALSAGAGVVQGTISTVLNQSRVVRQRPALLSEWQGGQGVHTLVTGYTTWATTEFAARVDSEWVTLAPGDYTALLAVVYYTPPSMASTNHYAALHVRTEGGTFVAGGTTDPAATLVAPGTVVHTVIAVPFTIATLQRVRVQLLGSGAAVYALWAALAPGTHTADFPFVDGAWANAIWLRANAVLSTMRDAITRVDAELHDAVLPGVRVGQWVHLQDVGLVQRLVRMTRDPLANTVRNVTLARRTVRLTRAVARQLV